MALTATLLGPADVAQVDAHIATLTTGVSIATQCSLSGPIVPAADWLRDVLVEDPPSYEVTVFADTKLAGVVIVWLHDNRIAWECVNNKHPLGFQAITGEINAYCVQRYGAAWGYVENPAVRAAMKAAQPAFVETGIILRLES